MSDEHHFFLHEDEWAMIDIMPTENMAKSLHTAHEAEEFSRAHYDGFGWTEIYVIPESQHPIGERRIMLSEIRELVGSNVQEADSLSSGIRPREQMLKRSFAFGDSQLGALYGHHLDGMIAGLHFLPPDGNDQGMIAFWRLALLTLGQQHRLILVDWWFKVCIDLTHEEMIASYLEQTGDDPEEDQAVR